MPGQPWPALTLIASLDPGAGDQVCVAVGDQVGVAAGDQVGVAAGVERGAVGGTAPGTGTRSLVVAGPVGEDVGPPSGEGVARRVLPGLPEVLGDAVPVVLLVSPRVGWGRGFAGRSMPGVAPEGLFAAGVGSGRTQR